MTRLMILMGSMRPGRLGLPIALWALEAAEERGGFAIDFVDLMDVRLPAMDEPLPGSGVAPRGEHARMWAARVERADAILFVTADYRGGYSTALRNALDYLGAEWRGMPVGIVGYGTSADSGPGAAALAALADELGMILARPLVHLSTPRGRVHGTEFHAMRHEDDLLGELFDELIITANG